MGIKQEINVHVLVCLNSVGLCLENIDQGEVPDNIKGKTD